MVNIEEVKNILATGMNIFDSSKCEALILYLAYILQDQQSNMSMEELQFIANSLNTALDQWNKHLSPQGNCGTNDINTTFGNLNLFE